MTAQETADHFTAATDAVRALPIVYLGDCLTGARRWIDRGLEQATRDGDQFYIDAFQGLLDNFNTEAADIERAMLEDDRADRGLDADGYPVDAPVTPSQSTEPPCAAVFGSAR